jgi:small GTP-binding protein
MALKRKICLLGATGVGKTSLVARYVRSIFSDTYQTTVGVKIDTKQVVGPGGPVDLVIWDLSGEDEFQTVQLAYLRGASGYLLVVDGTRRETLETSRMLHARASEVLGPVPLVVVANKCDLSASWDVEPRELETFTRKGWPVIKTSARTGAGVERAFETLVGEMASVHPPV